MVSQRYQNHKMNKQEYQAPQIKMVAFRTERGFDTSGNGFVKAADETDFMSIFSSDPVDEDGKYNGKYNDRFNETSIW